MADANRSAVLDVAGPAAPPRKNGELVFSAPWESRVFGMTMAMYERGVFKWEEFRQRLIAEIGRREAQSDPAAPWNYYACWAAALEQLLAQKGVCGEPAIVARARALAAREPGHDHRH